MFAGPIFQVEMVSAGRSGRYFLLRVIYAAAILFVLWATFLNLPTSTWSGARNVSISEVAQAAALFFWCFSVLQLVGLLAVAPAMAVGTIATERERRTIEYLFATDLSNLEIVLGKTLARLLLVGKFAAVSIPILFLFRLLGGIPAGLLAASFLITGSTGLFVTALSVCVSVWSKRSRDASIRIYLVLAVLLFLPPLLVGALAWQFRSWFWWDSVMAPALGFLNDLNPVVVLMVAMGGASSLGAGFNFDPVLHMAAWHAAISVGLIALATTAVRRVHLRELGRGGASTRRWWKLPLLPRWRPELRDNAMAWKESFAATSKTKLGVAGYLAILAIGATAVVGIIYVFLDSVEKMRTGSGGLSRGIEYIYFVASFTGMVGTGLLLLVASRASGLITVEKERDCWISLLSTPLTGREIMIGKILGNLYAVRWGMALLAVAWLLGLVFDFQYVFAIAAMAVAFLLCAWFVTCVGLYFSQRSATSLRAMGFTLAVCFFVGGGYLFCCCPIAVAGGSHEDGMLLGLAPCMPFLLAFPGIAYNNGFSGREMESTAPAFVIGLIGYLIASAVLANQLILRFDQTAGRTGSVPDGLPT